jgi:hypothetical protein
MCPSPGWGRSCSPQVESRGVRREDSSRRGVDGFKRLPGRQGWSRGRAPVCRPDCLAYSHVTTVPHRCDRSSDDRPRSNRGRRRAARGPLRCRLRLDSGSRPSSNRHSETSPTASPRLRWSRATPTLLPGRLSEDSCRWCNPTTGRLLAQSALELRHAGPGAGQPGVAAVHPPRRRGRGAAWPRPGHGPRPPPPRPPYLCPAGTSCRSTTGLGSRRRRDAFSHDVGSQVVNTGRPGHDGSGPRKVEVQSRA